MKEWLQSVSALRLDGGTFLRLLLGLLVLTWAAGWMNEEDHLWHQQLSEIQGHFSLAGLGILFTAGRLEKWIPGLLARRRWLGLLTFGFALLHSWEILVHDFGGSLEGIFFLPDFMQSGALLGVFSLTVMVPLALTSNDWSMGVLGRRWKQLHQYVHLATFFALLHTLATGVHYPLLSLAPSNFVCALLLIGGVLGGIVCRVRG